MLQAVERAKGVTGGASHGRGAQTPFEVLRIRTPNTAPHTEPSCSSNLHARTERCASHEHARAQAPL